MIKTAQKAIELLKSNFEDYIYDDEGSKLNSENYILSTEEVGLLENFINQQEQEKQELISLISSVKYAYDAVFSDLQEYKKQVKGLKEIAETLDAELNNFSIESSETVNADRATYAQLVLARCEVEKLIREDKKNQPMTPEEEELYGEINF